MAIRRIKVKTGRSSTGAIQRAGVSTSLNMGLGKKVSVLRPRKLKGIRPPGDRTKNFSSPSM